MSDETDVWELRKDRVVVGTLRIYDVDMFWFSSHFEPTPEFEPYRQLFSEGHALNDDLDAWDDWYTKINALGLSLVRLWDGKIASEFILYINEGDAHFRPRFDDHRKLGSEAQ